MRQIKVTLLFCCMSIFDFATARAQTSAVEGYKGIVTHSQKRAVGEQFTFANMLSAKPFVTFPSGWGVEFTKTFESDKFVMLFFNPTTTGSSEIFYLDKKSRQFTLIEASTVEAELMPEGVGAAGAVKPVVTSGQLK